MTSLSEFICPITLSIPVHPVTLPPAAGVFERQALTEWAKRKGSVEEVSELFPHPMTGNPVSLSAVEDATSVVETMWKVAKAHGFDEWDAATSSVSGANSHGSADSGSIMSCDPFAASLDPLRSALDLSIPGWPPPVLVTLGNEKSGKSTLLERLALSAFFPTDRAVATRVPVEIMMRRGPMQVAVTSSRFARAPSSLVSPRVRSLKQWKRFLQNMLHRLRQNSGSALS